MTKRDFFFYYGADKWFKHHAIRCNKMIVEHSLE